MIKVLLENVLIKIGKNNLIICLDKCMSVSQRENFENYIKTEFFSIFKEIPKIDFAHQNSCFDEGLQVTDFICGAFGYKYNSKDLKEESDYYIKIIKDKIRGEKNDLLCEREYLRGLLRPADESELI